jgi:hypothetical protein
MVLCMDWKCVGSGVGLFMGMVMDPRGGGKERNPFSAKGEEIDRKQTV